MAKILTCLDGPFHRSEYWLVCEVEYPDGDVCVEEVFYDSLEEATEDMYWLELPWNEGIDLDEEYLTDDEEEGVDYG